MLSEASEAGRGTGASCLMERQAAGLTLPEAARIMREAVREPDRQRYVAQTGLGKDVKGFLIYFRTERGKRETTAELYEYCLARLAIHYADLELKDFDGRHATVLIRDFLREHYPEVAGNTWNTRLATLKAFFRWAFEEDRIDHDPAARIRYRQVPESERQAHAPARIEMIVTAQTQRRDRLGVQFLGRLALRRNELRLMQLKHVNHDTRELTVFGKGGTVKRIPIFADLYEQLLKEVLDRQGHPDEFLLYPTKTGMVGVGADRHMDVIWDDRLRALSFSGVDKWWARCCERAGIPRFPMHELRHSAGTNFWRENRDLRLTQKLMRHKTIRTTADTYLHDDAADLAEAMGEMPAWEVE